MTRLRVLASRLQAALTKGRRDAELHEEIQAHLDLLTEEHMRRGLSLEEARAAARRAFGGVEQVKETYRDQRGLPILDALGQDVRYGLRTLSKSRGFTSVAILSLALGIGANCAIFGLVNAVLLKDLPVQDPDRLAAVLAYRGSSRQDFSYPIFRDLSGRQRVFSEMAASGGLRLNQVRFDGAPEELGEVDGAVVSASYFSLLGVSAVAGRVFTPEDSRTAGEGAVAVLGHGFWQRRFARDPSVVGRAIILNGTPFTILGVTPRGFFGDRVGAARDVWVPILMQPRLEARDMLERRTATWFRTIGRLRPGVSDERADAELTLLFRQLKADEIAGGTGSLISRDQPSDFRVEIERGSAGLNVLRRRARQPLALLTAVVGLVLLIACCNVANLSLARGAARQREIGIRLAMGCSRRRLAGQLLTESLLLSLAGGALGLALAPWTADALATQLAIGVLDLRPDARMLAFASAISVLAGLLFGLMPALQATSIHLAPALQASARTRAGSAPRQRIGRALVVSQVALSLWLLIGAGLLIRSLQNLRDLDVGVDRRHVLTLDVRSGSNAVPGARLPDLRRRLAERLGGIPGVDSVAFSTFGLFSGSAETAPVRVPGSRVDPERDGEVRRNYVSPDYFRTVGMTFVRGRPFGEPGAEEAPGEAVVNETMARHYFGEQDPLGRLVYFPKVDAQGRYVPFGRRLDREQAVEVVGVVRDAKYDDLRETPRRMAYLPVSQGKGSLGPIQVRTIVPPVAVASRARQVLEDVDPGLVLRGITTLEQAIDRTLAQERTMTRLLGSFAALALLLACVGVYGVMAYAVARRTSEIGVRMALGATRGEVVSMVLRETLLLVTFGVALGIPAALATTHLLRGLLFGLAPTDPATIVATAALMLGVAVLAGSVPARRAAGVDPMAALRWE